METAILMTIAVVMLLLLPLVPKVIVLRGVGLRSIGDWHERRFEGLVFSGRIAMIVVAGVLLVLGFSRM